jgi:transposase
VPPELVLFSEADASLRVEPSVLFSEPFSFFLSLSVSFDRALTDLSSFGKELPIFLETYGLLCFYSLTVLLVQLSCSRCTIRGQLEHVLVRLAEVEGRLTKESHNSSKPPASDGLRRKPHSQRKQSDKKSGGQHGHTGHSLQMVEQPDRIVSHRPRKCLHCHEPLEAVAGRVIERRQVHDLPVWRVQVSEHRVEEVLCPRCQGESRGTFPAEVSAPAQYGPGIRALAVYLHQYPLVPLQRTCEMLSELCGCLVSEGTLAGSSALQRRWGQL